MRQLPPMGNYSSVFIFHLFVAVIGLIHSFVLGNINPKQVWDKWVNPCYWMCPIYSTWSLSRLLYGIMYFLIKSYKNSTDCSSPITPNRSMPHLYFMTLFSVFAWYGALPKISYRNWHLLLSDPGNWVDMLGLLPPGFYYQSIYGRTLCLLKYWIN